MSQISDACGGGDGGRALVPGTLRGYRTWRLQRRPPADGALPLTSVTRRVGWPVTLSAECTPPEPLTDGLPEGAGAHRAPTAGCRCGIYAWYDPDDADILRARVFGVVQASGLVVLGERGFRAERATIAAVVTRNRRLARACERAGVAVYRRKRDLLADHPPEDLTALLGPRPAPAGGHHPVTPPQRLSAFDGVVLAAMLARLAVIVLAVVTLPPLPAVMAAAAAHAGVLAFLAARAAR